jgi:hypothetical protein
METDRKTRGVKIEGAAGDPLKMAQEEVNLFKGYSEAKQIAKDNPEDQNAQISVRVLGSRIKEAMGPERFAKAEFDYGQETYNRLFSLQGQKKQPDGTPADGLETKTADQLRIENLNSDSPMVPVVQTKLNKDGVEGIDDRGLENVPEGSMFAVKSNNGFKTYKKVSKGTYSLLDTVSPATPVKEKPAPAEGNPFRVEAEVAQTARGTQDLDDEIYGIQVKMEKLDKERATLTKRRNAAKDLFLGREFPRGISAGQARDEYDKIVAEMQLRLSK